MVTVFPMGLSHLESPRRKYPQGGEDMKFGKKQISVEALEIASKWIANSPCPNCPAFVHDCIRIGGHDDQCFNLIYNIFIEKAREKMLNAKPR